MAISVNIDHISVADHAEILARALPHIRQLHGKTVVIKYGGNAMTDPSLQAAFAADVVMLQLLGLKPVVVHGGGPQIEAALKRVGKTGQFIQGMRVTDTETMQVVQWVLAGQVQQEIVGLINLAGGQAVGLSGRDGGLIAAHKLHLADTHNPALTHDVGQVGDITHVNPAIVQSLQASGFIPVVSPIGCGAANESYNINADVVAGRLAQALDAEQLVMLTNTAGVLNQAGELLSELTAPQIDAMFADGTLSGGMLPKIASALDAAKSGVKAVRVVDGRVPHAVLLNLLSSRAVGTLIRSA